MKSILLLIVCSSCTVLYFKVPQPRTESPLSSFPESFRGRYLSEEGDTVTIETSRYMHPEKLSMVVPKSNLDSFPNIRIAGDKLTDTSLPEAGAMNYMIVNDTVYYEANFYQSQWLSDSLILKQFRKWVVVNTREDDYWLVYLIRMANDSLEVYAVKNLKPNDAEDRSGYDGMIDEFRLYASFEKIGESEYLLDPSNGEFRKLVKKGLFKRTMSLRKID